MLLCIAIKALVCWLCFCRFPQWLWGQIVKPPYFSRTLGIEPPNRPPRVRIRCSLSIKPKKTAHFVCASNIKLRWTVLFTHYRLPSSGFHKAEAKVSFFTSSSPSFRTFDSSESSLTTDSKKLQAMFVKKLVEKASKKVSSSSSSSSNSLIFNRFLWFIKHYSVRIVCLSIFNLIRWNLEFESTLH